MAEKLLNAAGLSEFSKKIKENAVFIKEEETSTPAILDLIYPVGSIYMSVSNVSPATFIGGTWVSFGQGRTLVGVDTSQTEFNTVQKTGGEKKHTLTIAEMPKHVHNVSRFYGGAGFSTPYSESYSGWGLHTDDNTGQNDIFTTNAGNDQSHNNLQPYITVYMWKRTA